MKIGYQLKQVRERLAKGLVDKGILRTEKRNFLLFDMATHPVADGGAKDEIRRRVRAVLTNRTVVLPASAFLPEGMEFRYLRTVSMLCAAYAANVLENALVSLGHESRERAFAQVDELLTEYSQWPFGRRAGGAAAIAANLDQVIRDEVGQAKDRELQLEVCLHIFYPIQPSFEMDYLSQVSNSAPFSGRRRLSQRLYPFGLSALESTHMSVPQIHPQSPRLTAIFKRRQTSLFDATSPTRPAVHLSNRDGQTLSAIYSIIEHNSHSPRPAIVFEPRRLDVILTSR